MRASVLSLPALGVALLAATCLPSSARMGGGMRMGGGYHFASGVPLGLGHDGGHGHHRGRAELGIGVDNGPDYGGEQGPPPVFVAPVQVVDNTPPAPAYVSTGPRIIIVDHHKFAKPRGALPLVIYGSPTS
jgi:hypothetical protein